jgi:hypothetical protein
MAIWGASHEECGSYLYILFKTMFPDDVEVDSQWMCYLTSLVIFDVLSTTLLLWGGAGAGPASESNPFMAYIVSQPFLHLGVKLMFALFTIIVANIMERNYKGLGTRIVQAACIPYMLSFTVNLFWIMYSVKLLFVKHWTGI